MQGTGVWFRARKIPHAPKQFSPRTAATEPARLELVLSNKRSPRKEKPMRCDWEWPLLAATRESPHTPTKTQGNQKHFLNNFFFKGEAEGLNTQILFQLQILGEIFIIYFLMWLNSVATQNVTPVLAALASPGS